MKSSPKNITMEGTADKPSISLGGVYRQTDTHHKVEPLVVVWLWSRSKTSAGVYIAYTLDGMVDTYSYRSV